VSAEDNLAKLGKTAGVLLAPVFVGRISGRIKRKFVSWEAIFLWRIFGLFGKIDR
jgi:hypothetical protein